jgi:hypothetical protein
VSVKRPNKRGFCAAKECRVDMDHIQAIEEVLRLPSPAPAPQALAFEGEHLWMGSWETRRMYGIDPRQGRVIEEMDAPGRPVGAVAVGDDLRVVVSEGEEDHRWIRRYRPGSGFMQRDSLACPDDTGSFLAFDGDALWLSQRYAQRILKLRADGTTCAQVPTPAQIIGIVWVAGVLYISLWYGKGGGCMLARLRDTAGSAEPIATVPFAAISLTHDGSRFWSNDPRGGAIVAFAVHSS